MSGTRQLYFWAITFPDTGKTGVLRTDGQGGILLLASDGTFTQVDDVPHGACERISHFADQDSS